jgi:hypothetical protein
MKYFILDVHKAYTPPRITGWQGMLDKKTIKEHGYNKLPKYHLFNIDGNMQTVFTDIIMHPCFMLSNDAMEVVQMYMPYLSFERVVLFDQANKKSYIYYLPQLEEKDVLTEKSRLNLDRSIIHHAEVDGNKVKEVPLIQVANVNHTCILIRSDLTESLLLRKMIGIGLRDTELVYN